MSPLHLLLFIVAVASATDSVQEFTKANNLFTNNVYEQISKTEKGNFLVSPFSAETILALTQAGARGESAEELLTALHLPKDQTKVESSIKELLPKFKDNGKYTLNSANKIYVNNKFDVKEEFKKVAADVYGAEAEKIDFGNQPASVINSWVEKQTNEKIKNLIASDDISAATLTVLINALYFKANWSTPFLLHNTVPKAFHKSESEKVDVQTLHHYEHYFNYYECSTLDAKFLELPFLGDEASMVIVLPNQKNGISNLETKLDRVFSLEQKLEKQFLNVALPKFKIEYSIDFIEVLKKLGVEKIFDASQADLSGIAGDKGELVVNKIKQKTFVDVNEEGVEAAAATFVGVNFGAVLHTEKPKDFIADHPFLFFIKVKDLIIFAGRVAEPVV